MKAKQLEEIHSRFFNSPAPIPSYDRLRFNKNLARRKPHQRIGEVICNNGTFRGNIKQTFKL